METALINIAPLNDLKIITLLNEVNGILQYSQKRVIANDDDLPGATNDLTLMANLGKAIKEKQKDYVDPIKQHLKSVNDAFNLLILPLGEADKITRDKILVYRHEQRTRQEEIEKINRMRIEAAQLEAKLNGTGEITERIDLIPDVPPPVAHVKTEVGTLGTMKVTKWEVVDFTLLDNQYKIPDTAKLTRVIKAGGPGMVIPGVRIWQEETLTIKSRT